MAPENNLPDPNDGEKSAAEVFRLFLQLGMIGAPPWLAVLLAAADGWGLQAAGL